MSGKLNSCCPISAFCGKAYCSYLKRDVNVTKNSVGNIINIDCGKFLRSSRNWYKCYGRGWSQKVCEVYGYPR